MYYSRSWSCPPETPRLHRSTGAPDMHRRLFPVLCDRGVQQVKPNHTTPERSALMKRVRRQGTDLEAIVRRALTRIGARYRLNVKGLPGSPDIANRRRKKAIFIHGCFWHHHEACGRGRIPTRNRDFWQDKLQRNVHRDRRKVLDLDELGYAVLTLWECELKDPNVLSQRLREFWYGEA
jgi:DNA mismatch endonuclease (patch repair protein)